MKASAAAACEMTVTLQWLAKAFCIGSWIYVSNLLLSTPQKGFVARYFMSMIPFTLTVGGFVNRQA
jgi:hypothetical protein